MHSQMHPARQLVPPKDPQAQERRLQEERRQPLHRQRGAEDVADQPRVRPPVHPELELLHQPGHHPHRHADQQQRAEEPGQPQQLRVLVAVPPGLQQRGQERQPDRDRDEEEMIHRRPGELKSRQVNRAHLRFPVLVYGSAAAGITGHSRPAGHQRASPRPGDRHSRVWDGGHPNRLHRPSTSPGTAISHPLQGMPPARPAGDSGTVTEHYDVIIIGSGAGGGTLAHTLAGSGKRFCCWSGGTSWPGRWTTGIRARCSSTGSTSPPTPGTTGTASRSSRRCTTSWAGRPRCTARRCTGCARRTSGRSSTSTGSPRPGRWTTATSSRGTRRPSTCTRCTATAVRIRPRATAASPTRGPRSPTSHGSSRSPMGWKRAATTRSTPRAGSC